MYRRSSAVPSSEKETWPKITEAKTNSHPTIVLSLSFQYLNQFNSASFLKKPKKLKLLQFTIHFTTFQFQLSLLL